MIEIAYHYCSVSTFVSIVEKKQLWLTSLQQANDSREGTWLFQSWLDKFSTDPASRERRQGAYYAVDIILRDSTALAMCFSEGGDILSQWRGYADDGRGVSIGFDIKRLQAHLETLELPPSLKKITYEDPDGELAVAASELLHDAFEPIYRTWDGGSLNIDYSGDTDKKLTYALAELYSWKNPGFREEKEWRLLAIDFRPRLQNIEYYAANGELKPVLKLDIPLDCIREIRLGPKNSTPGINFERYLSSHESAAKVLKSRCSYR